ncbi:hypothetical protein [Emticicia sp. C21]|uniref:hypothetical protein n=1 Tax=Emticicia sp. C21 TaxID=2302915 RepID=UPI000E3422E7|nr:hypothetical protein [Emticicia sp. C21]RFS15227.1 hypothetical protein D0T08_17010 [Emticicia sp. C21]
MNEHLEQLKEIRSMMERSSKFLSLSGLSGISAGICALAGAWYAHQKIHVDALYHLFDPQVREEIVPLLVIDALIVLISALVTGAFFTIRRARKKGFKMWNSTSKRLLVSMLIPLLAGGAFCIAMLYHGFFWLCFPATLIFYGIALVNASRYTVHDTFYLGISEIIIGIIALFLAQWNLNFWALGFGVLHIIYGAVVYFRYETK